MCRIGGGGNKSTKMRELMSYDFCSTLVVCCAMLVSKHKGILGREGDVSLLSLGHI